MANKFVVWIPIPTVGTNTQAYSDFNSDSQRTNGFVGGVAASAIRVNTAIRQANLIACALMNVLIPNNSTLDVNSSVDDLATELASHLSVDLNVKNGSGSGSVTGKNSGTVSGTNSTAFGSGNTVANLCAAALGLGLTSGADNQTIVGKYNASNASALFVVGNGSSPSSKSNAFVVLSNGRAKVAAAPVDNDDVVRKAELDTKISSSDASSSTPSDIASAGAAGTATTYSRSDHKHKGVSTITINGTAKTGSAGTIYGATTAGTSGQFLRSAGSGAPTWKTVQSLKSTINGVAVSYNPSSATSEVVLSGFYAPSSWGQTKQLLRGSGGQNSSPYWVSLDYFVKTTLNLSSSSFGSLESFTKGVTYSYDDVGGDSFYNALYDLYPNHIDSGSIPICCTNGSYLCYGFLTQTVTQAPDLTRYYSYYLDVSTVNGSTRYQYKAACDIGPQSTPLYSLSLLKTLYPSTFPTAGGTATEYQVYLDAFSPSSSYAARGRKITWEGY